MLRRLNNHHFYRFVKVHVLIDLLLIWYDFFYYNKFLKIYLCFKTIWIIKTISKYNNKIFYSN